MQKHTGDDSVMMLISIDEQSTCSNLCTACTFEIVRVQQVMLRETMDSQLLNRMYIRLEKCWVFGENSAVAQIASYKTHSR